MVSLLVLTYFENKDNVFLLFLVTKTLKKFASLQIQSKFQLVKSLIRLGNILVKFFLLHIEMFGDVGTVCDLQYHNQIYWDQAVGSRCNKSLTVVQTNKT